MIRNTLLVSVATLSFAASVSAQCSLEIRRQWVETHTSTEDVALRRSFVFRHSEPWPVSVCSIAVKTRNNGCTQARFHFEVRADGNNGSPTGALLASGPSMPIRNSVQIHNSNFTNLVLQPHTRYHVVMDYELTNGCGTFGNTFVHKPTATGGGGGTRTETWVETQQSGATVWLQGSERVRFRIRYEPHVRATSQNFGATCGISAPCSTTPYRSFNDNGNPLLGRRSAGPIAFRVEDSFGYPLRYVCGLDLRLGANSPTSVKVSILDERQTLPGQRITETTVALPAGPAQLVHVPFSAPARIRAGTNYWIAIESLSGQVELPIEAFGQPVAEATFNGLEWVSGGTNDSWSYRSYVTPIRPTVPTLDSDVPLMGSSFDVDLDDGPRFGLAYLLIGFQNPDLDLSVYGAPGCFAVASGEYTWLVSLDSTGRGSQSVAIPNNRNLLGTEFYCQYAPLMPNNPLGIIFTNGARNRIGTY